jgi:predicted Zn-ribbon and HTH transcriptional regulator
MKLKCPKCKNIFDIEFLVEYKTRCPSLQAPEPNLTIIPKKCPHCGYEIDEGKFWLKVYKTMVEGGREAQRDELVRSVYGGY